jgi:FAD synthetase
MVFGVFDKLHEGHRVFLRTARAHGDRLVVAVAPDEIVMALKDHAPAEPLTARMQAIIDEQLADEVLAGDKELGTWEIVKQVKPDVIALGYDQKELGEAIRDAVKAMDMQIEFHAINSHEPERFKSSLMP